MPGRKTPAFNSYASLQAMLPLLNLPLTSLGLSGPSWEGCKGEEFASPGVGGHSPENDSLRSLSPKLLSSGLPFTQQNKQLSSGLSATSNALGHQITESKWDCRSPQSGLGPWLCDPASSPHLSVLGFLNFSLRALSEL